MSVTREARRRSVKRSKVRAREASAREDAQGEGRRETYRPEAASRLRPFPALRIGAGKPQNHFGLAALLT
jgi:hypothetical protein